ncbi:hypothetical protein STRDD10_00947 [Streptococcus sp. DD10]|nr:hypothetical protein STRDD10_00947 [Streptococcus sp. DD10]
MEIIYFMKSIVREFNFLRAFLKKLTHEVPKNFAILAF